MQVYVIAIYRCIIQFESSCKTICILLSEGIFYNRAHHAGSECSISDATLGEYLNPSVPRCLHL